VDLQGQLEQQQQFFFILLFHFHISLFIHTHIYICNSFNGLQLKTLSTDAISDECRFIERNAISTRKSPSLMHLHHHHHHEHPQHQQQYQQQQRQQQQHECYVYRPARLSSEGGGGCSSSSIMHLAPPSSDSIDTDFTNINVINESGRLISVSRSSLLGKYERRVDDLCPVID